MADYQAIAAYVEARLEANKLLPPEDTRYRASARPVHRMGLAVEADFDVGEWARSERLDAVFLHRPWKLDVASLPPDIGVLMAHAPFDDHLTLGVNPRLANVLGLADWQPMGSKDGRPLGMMGTINPTPAHALRQTLTDIFGGLDNAELSTSETVSTIAVMNAMTDALVREAAARGAQAYVTGQQRAAARPAVDETGLSVYAVGHRRCEQWGLRALAGLLRERWASLEVCVAE